MSIGLLCPAAGCHVSCLQLCKWCVVQVSKYDDPQEAAIAVVVEAYRLWLQFEVRTDDITIIVACIDGLKDPLPGVEKKSMRYVAWHLRQHCF